TKRSRVTLSPGPSPWPEESFGSCCFLSWAQASTGLQGRRMLCSQPQQEVNRERTMRAARLPTSHRSIVHMVRTIVVLACALVGFSLSTVSHAGFHFGGGPVDEIDGQRSFMVGVSWETDQPHPWEIIVGHIDGRAPDPTSTKDVYFVAASKRFTWRG